MWGGIAIRSQQVPNTLASSPRVVLVAIALAVTAATPLSGAAPDASMPSRQIASMPFQGNSYAAWIIHHPGGPSIEVGVEIEMNVAPDAGAIGYLSVLQKVGSEIGAGRSGTVIFDDVDGASLMTLGNLQVVETSTYAGPHWSHTVIVNAKGMSEYVEPADYYVVVMAAQDGGEFGGEFRLFSDDAAVIASDAGDAFFSRDRDYPAIVNARSVSHPYAVHAIEGGVVEVDVEGRLFASFVHAEPEFLPVGPAHADGFWVEGPGIDGPLDGLVGGVQALDDECVDQFWPYPVCHLGTLSGSPFEGQNGGMFYIHDGDPGTYRFRVDHWNVVREPGLNNGLAAITLIGADVRI